MLEFGTMGEKYHLCLAAGLVEGHSMDPNNHQKYVNCVEHTEESFSAVIKNGFKSYGYFFANHDLYSRFLMSKPVYPLYKPDEDLDMNQITFSVTEPDYIINEKKDSNKLISEFLNITRIARLARSAFICPRLAMWNINWKSYRVMDYQPHLYFRYSETVIDHHHAFEALKKAFYNHPETHRILAKNPNAFFQCELS